MKRYFVTILLIILLTPMTATHVSAFGQDSMYGRLSKYSSDSLRRMGHRYLSEKGRAKEALICYSIITSRFTEGMTVKEKKTCMEAYLGQWIVYFYDFYDVTKLFELLYKAKDICCENNIHSASLWLYHGVMFQTLYEQTNHRKYGETAIYYYNKAFDIAKNKHHENSEIDQIVTNVLLTSYNINRLERANRIIDFYKKENGIKSNSILKQFNIETYHGLYFLKNKKYDKALLHFQKVIDIIPDDNIYFRYKYLAHFNKASVFAEMGDYKKAITLMDIPKKTAFAYDIKDAKIEIYSTLADYYKRTGNEKLHLEYSIKHYQLKDSVLNFQQAANVSETKFIHRINKLESIYTKSVKNKRIHTAIIFVTISIILIIATFLIVLCKQNKLLRQRNRTLYNRNVEAIKTDSNNKDRIALYKNKIADLEDIIDIYKAQGISIRNRSIKNIEKDSTQNTFSPSKLDTDYISHVAELILKVIEEGESVFTSDFSVQTLAEAAGVKYKTVSEVIHEKYGCNFNTFINGYRIREVCKRIGNEYYANLSMDGIMQSVGFKSRATFIAAFKKETGLKPSEYQKMTRENRKNKK